MTVILKIKVSDIASLSATENDKESTEFCESVMKHNDDGQLILVFDPYTHTNSEQDGSYMQGEIKLRHLEVQENP